MGCAELGERQLRPHSAAVEDDVQTSGAQRRVPVKRFALSAAENDSAVALAAIPAANGAPHQRCETQALHRLSTNFTRRLKLVKI